MTAADILAKAAFKEGRWVQAIPYFGAERRGAPIKAFTRIDKEPILKRSQVSNPDYVVVLDPFLTEILDVTVGLKAGGMMILNSAKGPWEMSGDKPYRIATVDATKIALDLNLVVSGIPAVNTAILGAFAKATSEVALDSIISVIEGEWKGERCEKNVRAVRLASEQTLVESQLPRIGGSA